MVVKGCSEDYLRLVPWKTCRDTQYLKVCWTSTEGESLYMFRKFVGLKFIYDLSLKGINENN